MTNYNFKLIGDQLKDLLVEEMKILKEENSEHPIFQATKMEMVSIPNLNNTEEFVNEFLQNSAKPNIMYIAILNIGTRWSRISKEVMTGRCNNKEIKHKGARKWETKYVLYEDQALPSSYIEMFDTKGEAVQAAKKYAIERDIKVVIELEKRLNGSSSRITDITPIKHSKSELIEVPNNHYLVFGKGA